MKYEFGMTEADVRGKLYGWAYWMFPSDRYYVGESYYMRGGYEG